MIYSPGPLGCVTPPNFWSKNTLTALSGCTSISPVVNGSKLTTDLFFSAVFRLFRVFFFSLSCLVVLHWEQRGMKYVLASFFLLWLLPGRSGWMGGWMGEVVHINNLSLSRGYAIEFNLEWNLCTNTLTLSVFVSAAHSWSSCWRLNL